MKHLFVIDDTGSPGNRSESRILKSDRKTYVSVFIHKDIRENLLKGLKELLDKYQITEFHFTDIINRRKQYKNYTTKDVVEIFIDFTDMAIQYPLPFFNQTITPRSLEENGLKNNLNKSLDEIALDFLLVRIKFYLVCNKINENVEFTIDEGLKKKKGKIEIMAFRDFLKDNYLTFESSGDFLLLQIADFFAFALNRNQMFIIKENKSEFDNLIIPIINRVLQKNESSGSKSQVLKNEAITKEHYDKMQIDYLKKMGVYDFWKKVNHNL